MGIRFVAAVRILPISAGDGLPTLSGFKASGPSKAVGCGLVAGLIYKSAKSFNRYLMAVNVDTRFPDPDRISGPLPAARKSHER